MPHYEHPQRKYLNDKKPEAKLVRLEVDWKEEYRETAGLLEEKLLNFVRLNRQIKRNITDRYHLIELYEGTIMVNLSIFNDSYIEKFIRPEFSGYCFLFMEQLRPVLLGYMQEVHIRHFDFRFKFKLYGLEMEKMQLLSLQ